MQIGFQKTIVFSIAIIFCGCNSSAEVIDYCGKSEEIIVKSGFLQKRTMAFLGDLVEGMDCAKQMNRPVLLVFTGYACVGYDSFRMDLLKRSKVRSYIGNQYVLVILYVDDKTLLNKDDTKIREIYSQHGIDLDSTWSITTIGHLNSSIQVSKFKDNSQLYYAILKPTGGQLIPSFNYNGKESEFLIQKLEAGIKVWNKNEF